MEHVDYKGHIAYWSKTSWYHRKKELTSDGTVKYGRIGGFKTPEEAEESYYKYEKEFEDAKQKMINPTVDVDILFSDYLKYWFENDYRKKVQDSTVVITSFAIYNLIIPNIKVDVKIRFITTEYLDELLGRISAISKSSGNKAKEVLSISLGDAVIYKLLANNPVDDIKKYHRGKAKMKLLNVEELKKLLATTKNDNNWYLEILLGLFCGLRKGEIFGLKFDDFDIENKTVTIKRQVGSSWEIGEYEFATKQIGITEKGPKTENSLRKISVPTVIIDELEKRKLLIDYYKSTNSDFEDHNYISCRPDGKNHALSSLNGYLNKACLKSAIPKITVHSLRHMYATILLELGVKLEKISKLMGHNSIQTTFDYYCDVISENDKILAYMNNEFSIENEDD